ncbi:MAG: ABC transporter substrate-binding protein, partial [Alphaproteobacteria bacterium]
QDIKIGAVLPLSGPNAQYGETFSTGINLAVADVNADHMLSKPLAMDYEDSQALPQPGVVAANKLVNVERVPFFLSAFTSVSKAVAPVADRSKTVAVNGGGVGPDLAQLGDYFWNVIPLANYEVRAMVPYLVTGRKLKRFVLVYVDDPLGEAIQKELKTELPKAGGELVAELKIPRESQQFTSVAARAREANPEVIYIASFGAQQSQIIKQFRDNGISQQIASYSGFAIPSIDQAPEAQGALYTSQKMDWDSDDPITKRFVAEYKAKYGKAPNYYAANYYNAVMLFAVLARTLEKKGEAVTGENLLKERRAAGSFNLVGGKMEFQPDGSVIMPMQVNEVDGKGGHIVK